DVKFLRRLFPKRWVQEAQTRPERGRVFRLHRILATAVVAIVLIISSTWMMATFVGFNNLPAAGQNLLRYSNRFASINSYGLFRSMTTSRPEIIVEGSADGESWLAYEFKWKPGDLSRRPGWVAPHQPRLDWQMWFAALGDFNSPRSVWFQVFLKRLLEGEPEVLRLLKTNPFFDEPPRFVRAVLYDYRFTDFEIRRDQKTWWKRTRLGAYSPVLSLESFLPE
ncbi:MAG: lipase maturation factor family protein, partial [Thermoanaerobaculia bacterium]